MKLSARSTALYSACFAGALLLSACGKNDSTATNPPAASGTAAAPAATATPPPASTAAAPAKPATAAAPASTAAAPAAASTAAAAAAPAVNAPAATPAATPAADTTFKVSSVTVGDAVSADHKVSKAKTSFPSNVKTIYASVITEGNTDGATLSAKWSYLDGKGELVNNISQHLDGASVTAFKVQNPNAWPEGKYKVEISLDGKLVDSKDFEIKKR